MNRWNTRNMLNKRDVFVLKNGIAQNCELLQRIDKKLNNMNNEINTELKQILEKCDDSGKGYGNVEILLKALMVDSLLKEISNEDGAGD